MSILIEIFGWVGMALVVSAYYLVSHKTVRSDSMIYQLMNLFGAIFVGVNVYYNKAWSSLALQCIWGVIAISAIIKRKER